MWSKCGIFVAISLQRLKEAIQKPNQDKGLCTVLPKANIVWNRDEIIKWESGVGEVVVMV
jgi:hypothetical protein